MLEFCETNASLRNLHTIRELDVDRDLLVDVSHSVSWIPEGVSDGIMDLTLLTYLLRFRLDLGIFIRTTSDRDWVYFLVCLAVPFVESWEINSVLCAVIVSLVRFACKEFLYRDILREALSLVQKPKALKIFAAVYHSSHSLNERKGIIFPLHTQYVKIDSLHNDL